MYELHEKGTGTKLVLITKSGGQVMFAEPGQTMPKLYKLSYEKWVAKGKPETIFI